MMLESMSDAIPPLRTGRRSRPRRRPENAHGDNAFDYRKCRDVCRHRAIQYRIAGRGIESKEKLGATAG
jgi:hypothetical protein